MRIIPSETQGNNPSADNAHPCPNYEKSVSTENGRARFRSRDHDREQEQGWVISLRDVLSAVLSIAVRTINQVCQFQRRKKVLN